MGDASNHDIVVDGERATNAAWCYPAPTEQAARIEDQVAFHSVATVTADRPDRWCHGSMGSRTVAP